MLDHCGRILNFSICILKANSFGILFSSGSGIGYKTRRYFPVGGKFREVVLMWFQRTYRDSYSYSRSFSTCVILSVVLIKRTGVLDRITTSDWTHRIYCFAYLPARNPESSLQFKIASMTAYRAVLLRFSTIYRRDRWQPPDIGTCKWTFRTTAILASLALRKKNGVDVLLSPFAI